MKTLYESLGVSPDASDEALKAAYRKLAKIHHPDHNPNDPDAARRFRQVAAAVAILGDANRRAAYNQRLVRELLRRLDRESERRRSQWLRIVAISGAAALVTGVVVAQGSVLVGPFSPKSVIGPVTMRNVERQTVGVSAAPHRERSNDEIRSRPVIVPPALTSRDDRRDSRPPEQNCKDETASGVSRQGSVPAELNGVGFDRGPHCGTPKGREADERGLSGNQRAALIRQAQELVASGDTRTARMMMQRACGNSSRCAPNSREDL
ncbi:J domain-containing protein [Bradyrhizobium sp.]|uniref:J domain-containing protein n=1 Tax=Bradyrhizobium sp. TaxID=376 RepID=UPI001EC46263|nr:J domain-containing protein [Bradyrhizobium sp.]MBV8921934.1 J domain-containing protein [Bradyrhizobium sp.]MBV9981710.1 J domain-containing protein [Bradyrhizobium sp.]